MTLNEQIEQHLSKFGDYYYIGDGKYECRDTGHVGTFADIVGIDTSRAPKLKPASAAKKAAAKSARDEIKHLGYRALKSGSPKQKAWAETIRNDIAMHDMIWTAHDAGDYEKARRIRDERDQRHRKFGI